MKGLDLSKFKKVAEDNKTVTMMHDKGHKMIIALQGLPKIQREQIKRIKMDDGGQVPLDPDKAQQAQQSMRDAFKFKDGGKVQHYAGDDNAADSVVSQSLPMDAPPQDAPPPPQAQINASPVGGVYGQQGKGLNELQGQNADNRQMIDSAHKAWVDYNNDPANAIDAQQYTKSMTLPHTVGTAIGLILSGAGSGITGGPNLAYDYLNKQIDRNIDQQKQNYQHQKNVWGAAHEAFADQNIADNFTKATLLDQVKARIIQSGLQNGTPQAGANAQQAINHINNAQEQLKNDSAQRLTNKQMQSQAQSQPAAPMSFMDKLNALAGLPESEAMKFANASPGISSNIPIIGEKPNSSMAAPEIPTPEETENPQKMKEEYQKIPETDPPPQIYVDRDRQKKSKTLGAEGVPGEMSPSEAGTVNDEIGNAQQLNRKIKLIHNNFETLWKNRSDANSTLKYLSGLGVNAGGFHIATPDMTSWTPQAREYFRAASTIENELSTLAGSGGGLTSEQRESLRNKLIKEGDTPDEYRNVLKSIDDNMLSTLKTPVSENYNIIKRPKR